MRQLSVDSGIMSMSHQRQSQSTRCDQVLMVQSAATRPLQPISGSAAAGSCGAIADETGPWSKSTSNNYILATPDGMRMNAANHLAMRQTSIASHHSAGSDLSVSSASDAVFDDTVCANVHGNIHMSACVELSTCV
jgi:hypothetical protein